MARILYEYVGMAFFAEVALMTTLSINSPGARAMVKLGHSGILYIAQGYILSGPTFSLEVVILPLDAYRGAPLEEQRQGE